MYLLLNTWMWMQIAELHFLSAGISGGSWWKKKGTVSHRLSWVKTFYHSPCTSRSHCCWRPSNTEIVWQALCKLHWSLRRPASHLPPILIAGSFSGRVCWDRQWQPEMMLLRQEKYKIPRANTHTHLKQDSALFNVNHNHHVKVRHVKVSHAFSLTGF